eukprot:TRINITY_DN1588_c0_g1_i1.p1 TRINITY_DN1588_c0_g1~~TRINITY_DN1588_c0_g1_i1.p1  ORF type:complete len:202 (+),score=21.66 TRINITY_DN1588_c0_g1_i1:27-608(+)
MSKLPPPSANWQKLKGTVAKPKSPNNRKKFKKVEKSQVDTVTNPAQEKNDSQVNSLKPKSDSKEVTKILGLDCEMVGIGPKGIDSALARVTIVNAFGNVIYDKYVQAQERVTDYRTKISGITKDLMDGGEEFKQVQQEVSELIKDKIVVGHGLRNDFRALMLSHPMTLTRDTARYGPLQVCINNGRSNDVTNC